MDSMTADGFVVALIPDNPTDDYLNWLHEMGARYNNRVMRITSLGMTEMDYDYSLRAKSFSNDLALFGEAGRSLDSIRESLGLDRLRLFQLHPSQRDFNDTVINNCRISTVLLPLDVYCPWIWDFAHESQSNVVCFWTENVYCDDPNVKRVLPFLPVSEFVVSRKLDKQLLDQMKIPVETRVNGSYKTDSSEKPTDKAREILGLPRDGVGVVYDPAYHFTLDKAIVALSHTRSVVIFPTVSYAKKLAEYLHPNIQLHFNMENLNMMSEVVYMGSELKMKTSVSHARLTRIEYDNLL